MKNNTASSSRQHDARSARFTPGHPEDAVVNPARLAVFCAVVEHGSFTRAAEHLYLTQPTVSGHIRALEQAFGTHLFDRRLRGAQLTEAGRAVHDLAVTVRRELGAVRAHLSDLAAGEAGMVTLGAGQMTSSYILAGLLAQFHRQHPAVTVQLRVLHPSAVGGEVLQGHLDLGVASENSPIPRSLRAEPLFAEGLLLVAPPEHRLATQSPVTIADLAGEAFIASFVVTQAAQALDTALMRAGLPPRRIVMELGTHDAVKEAVRQGVGLAILHQRVVAPELAARQLVALSLVDYPVVGVEEFFLVYRHAHRFSPLASNLMAFLREQSRLISGQPLDWPADQLPPTTASQRKPTIESIGIASAAVASSELTDEQWAVIQPVLSSGSRRGRPRTKERRQLNGILWVLTSKASWTEVPHRFGTPAECQRRFEGWRAQGVWQRIWEAWLSTLENSSSQRGEQTRK